MKMRIQNKLKKLLTISVAFGSSICLKGDFFVTSGALDELRRYDNNGSFIGTSVLGVGADLGPGFTGLTVGPDSALYFGWLSRNTIWRYDPISSTTTLFAHAPAPMGLSFGRGNDSSHYDLFVASATGSINAGGNILQFDGVSGDFEGKVVEFPKNTQNGPLKVTTGPMGIGDIYGVERGGALFRYAANTQTLQQLTGNIGAEQLWTDKSPGGELYVSTYYGTVLQLDTSGKITMEYTLPKPPGTFGYMCAGVIKDENSNLYVAVDSLNYGPNVWGPGNRVVKFSPGGEYLGDFIAGVGQPYGLAFGGSLPSGVYPRISEIPEPATVAFLTSLGLLVVAIPASRRRNRSTKACINGP